MSELTFRDLKPSEIQCRAQSVKKNGWVVLLYKDARCDMNILDETVSPMNWKKDYQLINGSLFCTVSIKTDDEWVSKQDVGSESMTEKEKGQASDAFKRACFNWGIGRELYTSPFIWIKAKQGEVYESGKDRNGKPKYSLDYAVSLSVKSIVINDGVIEGLEIVDQGGNTRYKLGDNIKPKLSPQSPKWGDAVDNLASGKVTLANIRKHYDITDENKLQAEARQKGNG